MMSGSTNPSGQSVWSSFERQTSNLSMDPFAPMDIDSTAPASMCSPFGGTSSMVPYSTTFGISSSLAFGSTMSTSGFGAYCASTSSFPSPSFGVFLFPLAQQAPMPSVIPSHLPVVLQAFQNLAVEPIGPLAPQLSNPAFGSIGTAFQVPSSPLFGSAGAYGDSSTPAFGSSSSSSNPTFGASSVPGFGSPSLSCPSTTAFGSSTSTVANTTEFGQTSSGGPRRASTVTAYKATPINPASGGRAERVVSISAMPGFEHKSHEELEWEDYKMVAEGGLAPAGWSGCGMSTIQSYPTNPAPTFAQTSSNSFTPTFCSSGTFLLGPPPSFSTQSQTFETGQTSTGGFYQAQPGNTASLGGSAGILDQNNSAQSSAPRIFSAIPQVEASFGGTVPSIQNGISGMPVRDKPASTQSSAAIVAAVNHAITYGLLNAPVQDKPASTQSSAAIVAAVNHAMTYGLLNTPVGNKLEPTPAGVAFAKKKFVFGVDEPTYP